MPRQWRNRDIKVVTSPVAFAWMACSISEFGNVGEQSHLVRPGQLDTLCGASASHAEIWRRSKTKPKCKDCQEIAWKRQDLPLEGS